MRGHPGGRGGGSHATHGRSMMMHRSKPSGGHPGEHGHVASVIHIYRHFLLTYQFAEFFLRHFYLTFIFENLYWSSVELGMNGQSKLEREGYYSYSSTNAGQHNNGTVAVLKNSSSPAGSWLAMVCSRTQWFLSEICDKTRPSVAYGWLYAPQLALRCKRG